MYRFLVLSNEIQCRKCDVLGCTPSMDKVVKYIVWNIAGKVTVVQKNWQLQYQRLSLQGCMVSMIQYNLITIIWDFFSTKLVIIYCGRQ